MVSRARDELRPGGHAAGPVPPAEHRPLPTSKAGPGIFKFGQVIVKLFKSASGNLGLCPGNRALACGPGPDPDSEALARYPAGTRENTMDDST